MNHKKKNLAQASLEYLITYGWALVAIATIVGVLIFATGTGVNSNTCTTFLHLICKGVVADGDTLTLVLQNATGQAIKINPFTDISFGGKYGYATIDFQGTTYRFNEVTIPAGGEFTIEGTGMVLTNEMTISYYETQTGLTKTETSNISTDAPDNIELSNDGVDNDGDGMADCAQAEIGPCEYVVEATGISPSLTVNSGGVTITIPKPEKSTGGTITDDWKITSAHLAFNVTEISSGAPTANTSLPPTANSITPITVKTGWNIIELDFSADIDLTTTNNFILTASSGTSFKISDNPTPRVVITLEEDTGGGF